MATAGPKFKYEVEVNVISSNGFECPPKRASEKAQVAYRWVAKPMSAGCFNPQAVRNPPRLYKSTDQEEKCSCWALSMHTSLDASVTAFQNLEASFKQARKIFGGWVAEGTVLPAHGKCTPADANKHFDLHEYRPTPIAAAFRLLSSIPVAP